MLLRFSRQYLAPSLTALVCFTGIIFFQKQYYSQALIAQKNINYFQQEQSLKTALNIQKKIPTFGFSNLIADWNFLKYIQYFGDEQARQETGYPLITDYFEIIVEKDPRFIQGFLSLSTANSIFAGRPDRTVTLMNQALNYITPEKFPNGYYIWTYKGVDEILFLGDLKAAENSYQRAAEWASLQKDPTWEIAVTRATETAQFLATNPDSNKVQIYAWLNILSSARDEKTKQHALQQVRALGAEIIVTETGELRIKLPTEV
jgi:hypothetical protein